MALEMAAYDNQLMGKEDFGIITTTQEGILNTLNIMCEEIGKHTSIIFKKPIIAAIPAENQDI